MAIQGAQAASSIPLFQKYDAIIITIITSSLLLLLVNGWVALKLHYSSHKYSNKLKKEDIGVFVPLLEHLLVLMVVCELCIEYGSIL